MTVQALSHITFASQHPDNDIGDLVQLNGLPQILWPDHCIQNSNGAEFVPTLDTARIDVVFRKGTDRDIDSYSGFFDNGQTKATGLGAYLTEGNIETVYVVGLATDYCVKFTAIDARSLGFNVKLILDGVRGVELTNGDCDRAMAEMAEAGVEIVRSTKLI